LKVKKKIVMPASGAELAELLTTPYAIDTGAALALVQVASQALDMALQAELILEKDGLIIQSERGSRAHPAASISRDSRNRLLAAFGKLNLEL